MLLSQKNMQRNSRPCRKSGSPKQGEPGGMLIEAWLSARIPTAAEGMNREKLQENKSRINQQASLQLIYSTWEEKSGGTTTILPSLRSRLPARRNGPAGRLHPALLCSSVHSLPSQPVSSRSSTTLTLAGMVFIHPFANLSKCLIHFICNQTKNSIF